ncbi:DUF6801 domain-containing protein [Streptomyces monticola]|uniref:DUF6801 domain-containing protein n=1 Tax=Streptomyces monticola TaxID=2666263 RepID=A0ABW2JAP7_9ACTN
MGVRKRRQSLQSKVALGVAGALGAASALVGIVGGQVAQAVPIEKDLTVKCKWPLIQPDILKVKIKSDMPEQVDVGKPTGKFVINADATVSENAAVGLGVVGGKTIEGTAKAKSSVSLPGGENLKVTVDTKIAKTKVPDPAKSFTTKAKGETPSLQFEKAGKAKITVDDLDLELRILDANGKPTSLGDPVKVDCALDPAGQNNVLHEFTIGDGGGQDPGTDPTTDPGTDPTDDPGTDPTDDPGTDPTDDPGTDPTDDPGTDPTDDPGTDPTDDPGTDPTTPPGSDPTDDPGAIGGGDTTGGTSGGGSSGGGSASGAQLGSSGGAGSSGGGGLAVTGSSGISTMLGVAAVLTAGGVLVLRYMPGRSKDGNEEAVSKA